MPLQRLKDYYPDYRDTLADGQMKSIDSYSVYAQRDDRVGTAKDLLVDESGRFRYLVIDTGPWIFGKNVLLPIGLARFDYSQDRIYVSGLSKEQVENLPEYREDTIVDDRYENQVRGHYQPIAQGRSNRQFLGTNYDAPNDANRMNPLEASTLETSKQQKVVKSDVAATPYDREPSFYGLSDEDNHGPLRLYEERLVSHRDRKKVGEVSVGKRVTAETAEIVEPVTKERVVIERHNVADQPAATAGHNFEDQEVARMEVYEDEVSVEKQAFVREEVNVRKETDEETVRMREKVRREDIDIQTDGNPRLNR
ncbi:DUF2382 domain-containing protein [Nodosilinea sp. E11]|uniref:DUF2382 domain-containing protein n=1 Tax=Nodosilinea sp. E11 TaxID=3037479 RepID=UPI0029352D18|nr:DUF2382 domain-containing protein [Nodosilinea sp. E11]WOD39136.1 DUF2382 domain-containing protein [Nodosilinea sp. E11]